MVGIRNQTLSMERKLSNKKKKEVKNKAKQWNNKTTQWKIKNHRNKRERKQTAHGKKTKKWHRFQKINKYKKIRSKHKRYAIIEKNDSLFIHDVYYKDIVNDTELQDKCKELYSRIMAKMGSLSCQCSFCLD